MSAAEPLYATDISLPQELIRGRGQTVALRLRDASGDAVTPSAVTYTLYRPDETKAVDAGVGTAGVRSTYAIDASALPTTAALGEGWREEWACTVDGVTHVFERDAAVVQKKLWPTITDSDLEAQYSQLATYRSDRYGSWVGFIGEAWTQIKLRLISDGHLPYLIRTPSSLRMMHIHLALHLIFRDFYAGGTGPEYLDLQTHHMDQYEQAYLAANWKIDYDHDGRVDDHDEREGAHAAIVHPNVPPRRRLSSKWGVS